MGVLTRLAALFAAGLALSVGSSRAKLGALTRTNQHGLTQLEMTPNATANWFGMLPNADDGTRFTFVEHVRAGTPGFQSKYPGSPVEHVHLDQEETFTVLEGTFGCVLNGKEIPLKEKGESVVVPAGARHFFYNAGDLESPGRDLEVEISLRPPKSAKLMFMNLAGLSKDYGGPSAIPILQILLLLDAGGNTLALPRPMLWALKHATLPLARLHGYKPFYDAYDTGL